MAHTLMAQVNPLMCTEIELAKDSTPTAEQLLDYLGHPEADRRTGAFVTRYRELEDISANLGVAPSERTILDKLVWPLRHAKGSYALANYLGCIALSGMVGEMVAILLWDISKPSLNGNPLVEAEQQRLFNSTVERLGQDRRVQVLQAFRLIDAQAKAHFDTLRNIRKRYLHFLSQAHDDLPKDAQNAFRAALHLVLFVLGQSYQDGSVLLRPELTRYLEERGIITSTRSSRA